MGVGVKKNYKEEWGDGTNANLLGIHLKPSRTDLVLLLIHRRSADRKFIATKFPRR